MLTTLREHRQTPDFWCLIDHEFDDWVFAPVGQSRDSDHLEASNFAQAVEMLEAVDTEDGDFQVYRFGHFLVGWVESILVRPGSECEEVCEDIVERLENYPVLNEEDFSRREWEDYLESWSDWGRKCFVRSLVKEFWLENWEIANALDDIDAEQLREFYRDHAQFEYEHDSGGCILNTDRAAKAITRDQLAAFLWAVRKDARQVA